jgi:hypothetical protein
MDLTTVATRIEERPERLAAIRNAPFPALEPHGNCELLREGA